MELTEEQYAALKVCYDKVKPVKDALTAQHSALAARLAQLQSSQHTKQRAFEHGAQEVYSWVHAASAGSQAPGATAAGMTPQATLLARQAQRAKELKEQQHLQQQLQLQQQQQLAAMQQLDSNAAAANEQGLLQLGSVALRAKVASAADADQLAVLLSQGLQEAAAAKRSSADSHRVVADGGFEAFVADNCPLSPACGTVPTATAFTAAPPHVAATSAMQQRQQQQRQVRFAESPVEQQHSAPSPQPQTSADAAEQFRQSFVQPDAAAAAATGRAGSSEVAVKVEESEYQFAIIDQVLDDDLLLDQITNEENCVENCMESGTATATAAAAAAPGAAVPEGGASSSGYLNMGPAGGSGSSDNTQLLIGGAAGMNNNSVAAPAAAAARSGAPLQMLSRDEVAAAVLGAVQDGASSSSTGQGLNSVIARSSSQCQRDLLMHVGSKEQQQVEQEMDRITSQLKMQQYCLALHMHNVCSKKQIALHYLHCFPFVPEAFSCESLCHVLH
jgi:hypothetical protein